jgi:hypothetical protein
MQVEESAMSLQVEVARSHRVRHPHQKQTERKQQQREKRKQELAAKRKQRLDALPAVLKDDQVLSFAEWCALNKLSERNGRRIVKAAGGPILTQISARHYGVTVANNRVWQASRARS